MKSYFLFSFQFLIIFTFSIWSGIAFSAQGDYFLKRYDNQVDINVANIFPIATGSGNEVQAGSFKADDIGIDYNGWNLSLGVQCNIMHSLSCLLELGANFNHIISDNFYNQNVLADVGIENNSGQINSYRIQNLSFNNNADVDVFQLGVNVVLPIFSSRNEEDDLKINFEASYGNEKGAFGIKIDSKFTEISGVAKLFLENNLAPRIEFSKSSGIKFAVAYDKVGDLLHQWETKNEEGKKILSLDALEADGLAAYADSIDIIQLQETSANFLEFVGSSSGVAAIRIATLAQVQEHYTSYRTLYEDLLDQLDYFPDHPRDATTTDWALFQSPTFWIQSFEYDRDFSTKTIEYFKATFEYLRYYTRTRAFAEEILKYYPYDIFETDNKPDDYRAILLMARNLGGNYKPALRLNTLKDSEALQGSLGKRSTAFSNVTFDTNLKNADIDINQLVEPSKNTLFFYRNHDAYFNNVDISSAKPGGYSTLILHEIFHNIGYNHSTTPHPINPAYSELTTYYDRKLPVTYSGSDYKLRITDSSYLVQVALDALRYRSPVYFKDIQSFYVDDENVFGSDEWLD